MSHHDSLSALQKPDMSVRRRSHNDDKTVKRFVINCQAERAPPFVALVEVFRPAGRPSVNLQPFRSSGKKGGVDALEIAVIIGIPVWRAEKRFSVIQPFVRVDRREQRFAADSAASCAFYVVRPLVLKKLARRNPKRGGENRLRDKETRCFFPRSGFRRL